MKTFQLFLTVVCCCTGLLTLSAQDVVYSPSQQYLLGNGFKEDLKLAISKNPDIYVIPDLFEADNHYPLTLQGAYSPLNHLSVVGSYTRLKRSMVNPNFGFRRFHLEIAPGFYHRFKTSKNMESYILLSLYVGSAWGGYTKAYGPNYSSLQARYQNSFFHPGVNFLWKYLNLGFGWRFNRFQFYKINTYNKLPTYASRNIKDLKAENVFTNARPALHLGVGWPVAKISFTFSPLFYQDSVLPFLFYPESGPVNFALVLDLNDLQKIITRKTKSKSAK